MTEQAPDRCRRYRRRILEISRQVTAAHVAPAFSCLEIVDALYSEIMRPNDIFIMSKGHGCLAQYVVLEDKGWWPRNAGLLDSYCQPGGRLGAHPDYAPELGIHASTGSLGHGLGIAAGQALAEQQKNSGVQVYVLLSDGECQEGSTWEAAMVAANLRLTNLTALVDYNDWGGMDRMSVAFPAFSPREDRGVRVDGSLGSKFRAFGWWVPDVVDGHHVPQIVRAVELPTVSQVVRGDPTTKPKAVICRTTKGTGVSFMENAPIWHYRSPNEDEYKQAMEELADAAQV